MRTLNRSVSLAFSAWTLYGSAQPSTCVNTVTPVPQISGFVTLSVTDFGADGSDYCSDHDAFVEAAAWFNVHGGNGILLVPAGEYIVGKQVTLPYGYNQGQNVLSFFHCSNLSIIGEELNGEPLSRLRFDDCLRFGAFLPDGNRRIPICAYQCVTSGVGQYQYLSDLGAMIYLDQCSNVAVRNLELNGNIDDMSIGGKWGDIGIQAGGDGVITMNSGDISVVNVDAHHHGRDGMLVYGDASGFAAVDAFYSTNYSGLMNISLRECKMEWNSRMGLTLGAGNGVTADGCAFNWNGAGPTISSSPAAGVDIEYHGAYEIKHSTFTGCEFKYNKAWGVISDAQFWPQIEDHRFVGCTFVGSDGGAALRASARAMSFSGCKIAGTVSRVYDLQPSDPPNFRTTFTGCAFSDEYNGEAIGGFVPGSGPSDFMINAPSAAGLLIDRCVFSSRCGLFGFWIHGAGPPSLPSTIQNSRWYFSGESNWLLLASCSNMNVSGYFEVHYPTGLPYPWSFNLPSVVAAGATGVNTGQPTTSCAGLVHYVDPPSPTLALCYSGSDCDLVLSEPPLPCDGIPTCVGNSVTLTFDLNGGGNPITWEIFVQGSSTPLFTGGPLANSTAVEAGFNYCLPDGCYRLVVHGTGGIPNGGDYTLSQSGGTPIILASGNWSSTSRIINDRGFCVPTPGNGVLSTSFDQDRHLGTVIRCGYDPLVQAGYPSANFGYQYWLFDPHGTYSRRFIMNHQQAMLTPFGPPGPDDCAWVLPASLQTNEVPLDIPLNVKVRPVIGAVPPADDSGFGYAWAVTFKCMMGASTVDDAPNDTKVNDDGSSPEFSCGSQSETEEIYAVPVQYANRYQFLYDEMPPGGPTVQQQSAMNTHWVDPSSIVTPGVSYSVKARTSYNAGITWCPFDASCVIDATFFDGGGGHMALIEGPSHARIRVWPNPSGSHSELVVRIDQVPTDQRSVPLDLLDGMGRAILNHRLSCEGCGTVQGSLPLGDLAPGLYFIRTVLNGEQVMERLTVE